MGGGGSGEGAGVVVAEAGGRPRGSGAFFKLHSPVAASTFSLVCPPAFRVSVLCFFLFFFFLFFLRVLVVAWGNGVGLRRLSVPGAYHLPRLCVFRFVLVLSPCIQIVVGLLEQRKN